MLDIPANLHTRKDFEADQYGHTMLPVILSLVRFEMDVPWTTVASRARARSNGGVNEDSSHVAVCLAAGEH